MNHHSKMTLVNLTKLQFMGFGSFSTIIIILSILFFTDELFEMIIIFYSSLFTICMTFFCVIIMFIIDKIKKYREKMFF